MDINEWVRKVNTRFHTECSYWKEFVKLRFCCICRAHRDGGSSQGGTRHSLPPARRRGGFNSNDQLNSSTERWWRRTGYNSLSRQSKIRQMIPLPLKRTQAPEEACFLVTTAWNRSWLRAPASEQSATKCLGLRRVTKCPKQTGALTFIWSVMSHSPSTSERCGLNGGKASDWLRPYVPNWALSDFAGGVQLSSSDGWGCFEPIRFLAPSILEGKWGAVDWEAGGLADARHIFTANTKKNIRWLWWQ